MLVFLHSLAMFVIGFFKSPRRLEAENLFLRHQLSIALRRAPSRLRLRGSDRALLVWMTRLWPSLLGATQVVQPETILRWHRAGFKAARARFIQSMRSSINGAMSLRRAATRSAGDKPLIERSSMKMASNFRTVCVP